MSDSNQTLPPEQSTVASPQEAPAKQGLLGKLRAFLANLVAFLNPFTYLSRWKGRKNHLNQPVITSIKPSLTTPGDSPADEDAALREALLGPAPTTAETPAEPLPPLIATAPTPSWKNRLLSLRAHFENLFSKSDAATGDSAAASPATRKILLGIGLALLLVTGIAAGYYASVVINAPERETPRTLLAKRGLAFDEATFISYAERGNVKVVDLFLDAEMNINATRPFDGYTALIGAAERGHADVVKLLLDRGANVKTRDRSSQPALTKAAAAGHLAVAQTLINYGADVNAIDKYGASPLKYAIKYDRVPLAELLRKSGAQELAAISKTGPTASAAALPLAKPQVVDLSTPVVPIAREFAVAPGQAGEVKLGMTAEGIRSAYAGSRVLTDEIYTAGVKHPVFTIYLNNQTSPALSVNIGNTAEKTATSIEILDGTFKTTQGIGVGSTLGDLRRRYTVANITYEDGSFWATVPDAKLRFEIKLTAEVAGTDWLNGANTAQLPDNLPIQRIILY